MDGAGTEAHLIVAYGFSSRVCIIHYEILFIYSESYFIQYLNLGPSLFSFSAKLLGT